MSIPTRKPGSASTLAILLPGLLLAATGVGAGDLATGALTGSRLGLTVLWAAVAGACFKFVLTEGLARWQLATGETLLEGLILRLGPLVGWGFGAYLILWSFQVGSALIAACGVAAVALVPGFHDPREGVLALGLLHSIIAAALVWAGSFRLFERVMSIAIGLMFAVALVTAARVGPEWGDVLRGLVVPRIPSTPGGASWTLAFMGGVGGTLTLLCYGYWIREEGREGPKWIPACRVDLAAGYAVVALFGIAMAILGSQITIEGGGAALLVHLGDRLEATLGPTARWTFLVGAWAAVFSSLLGVWQAAPYLFADFWSLVRRRRAGFAASHRTPEHRMPEHRTPESGAADPDSTLVPEGAASRLSEGTIDRRSRVYRAYLLGLATVPVLGVMRPFEDVQRTYAVFGALVMPGLAAALLTLNGKRDWVGEQARNRPLTVVVLVGVLLFFLWVGIAEVGSLFGGPGES